MTSFKCITVTTNISPRATTRSGVSPCVYSRSRKEKIGYNFWVERIRQAYLTRVAIGLATNPNNNVYRLVHGEGDDLSGLVIDYYAGLPSCNSIPWECIKLGEEITKALLEVMGDKLIAIYDKSEGTLPFKAGLNPKNDYLYGHTDNFTALENGFKIQRGLAGRSKDRIFVDQQENRRLLEQYAHDKNVLNMFCYTGGFSFYAMRGGAKLVHSVDASARAIELTNQNVELNFPGDTRHEAFVEDAFKFLDKSHNKYDLIILDPPALAKHQNVLDNAIQRIQKLNRKGIEVVKPGGLIFTFSCSQVMTKDLFRQTVFTAAANTGRKSKSCTNSLQPADHPISIYHPEGEYFKRISIVRGIKGAVQKSILFPKLSVTCASSINRGRSW